MSREIHLIKNKDEREWDDLQWVDEFYSFLKGKLPKGIKMPNNPKLSEEQAFLIVWYLQEHFSLIPDRIDRCDVCGILFDSDSQGKHTEHPNEKGHHNFCDTICEARFDFPVRSIRDLLIEVKDTFAYNPNSSWQNIVTMMYEGDDSINRDERFALEIYFDQDIFFEMPQQDRMKWLENEIVKEWLVQNFPSAKIVRGKDLKKGWFILRLSRTSIKTKNKIFHFRFTTNEVIRVMKNKVQAHYDLPTSICKYFDTRDTYVAIQPKYENLKYNEEILQKLNDFMTKDEQ